MSSATQVALQRLLDAPEPVYRHHLLLLEEREGAKLAKLHGAVAAAELRSVYTAPQLCGVLAQACGLRDEPEAVTPRVLLDEFRWEHVRREDQAMRWTGERLQRIR
jgi:glutamyl/glutaminyl-tRNA synthetase